MRLIRLLPMLLTLFRKEVLPPDLCERLKAKVHGHSASPVPASKRNKWEPVTIEVSPGK